MMNVISSNLLWTEGFYILIGILVSSVLGLLFFRPLWYASLIFFLFSVYFFRNPVRLCQAAQSDSSIIVSPADGTIVDVHYDKNFGFDGFAHKISIFLSPFDVHVNWTPMAGTIENIVYRPGTFSMAFLPKSSELNERNDIIIVGEHDRKITVRQIAGTIARRICCWVSKGQTVSSGFKYGMIRFGSRVDVLLPENVTLDVGVGQQVCGGSTILARWQ